MAITYVSAGTAAENATAATTLAVPYPTSPQSGDLIVLYVGVSSATSPTNPSGAGFTSAINGASSTGTSSPAFRISYKVSAGTESGNLSVTTPNVVGRGRMYLFRGVDNTTPLDVAGVADPVPTTEEHTLAGITTTMANCALFVVGGGNSNTATWTTPTTQSGGWNSVWADSSPIPTSGNYYKIWTGSGATGTINLICSGATRGYTGIIALRPAVDAPNEGTATGTWAFTGAAVGQRVPKGTATGIFSFAGAAEGVTGTAVSARALTAGQSGVDGTTFTTASVSPAAGCSLVLFVTGGHTDGLAENVFSVSGLGLDWTIGSAEESTPNGFLRGCTYNAVTGGTPPTPGALTITYESTHHNCSWHLIECSNVRHLQGEFGSGSTGFTSITLPDAITEGSAVLGFLGLNSTSSDWVAGAGYTLLSTQQQVGTPQQTTQVEFDPTGTTTVGATCGDSTAGRFILGLEILKKVAVPDGDASGTWAFTGAAVGRRVAKGVTSSNTPLLFEEKFDTLSDETQLSTSNTGFTTVAGGFFTRADTDLSIGEASAKLPYRSGGLSRLGINLGSPYKPFAVRFYLRLSAFPVASEVVLAEFKVTDDTPVATLRLDQFGDLTVYNGPTPDNAGTIPSGEWVRVEWRVDETANEQVLRLFTGVNLHGTVPDQEVFAAYTSLDIQSFVAGQSDPVDNSTFTSWWDEIALATDWIGPVSGWRFTGTAVGKRVAKGTATGTWAFAGAAKGTRYPPPFLRGTDSANSGSLKSLSSLTLQLADAGAQAGDWAVAWMSRSGISTFSIDRADWVETEIEVWICKTAWYIKQLTAQDISDNTITITSGSSLGTMAAGLVVVANTSGLDSVSTNPTEVFDDSASATLAFASINPTSVSFMIVCAGVWAEGTGVLFTDTESGNGLWDLTFQTASDTTDRSGAYALTYSNNPTSFTASGSSMTFAGGLTGMGLSRTFAWANVPRGSASGTWAFSGTAVGEAPITSPPSEGSATGTWVFVGTAAGARLPKAAATGAWAISGSTAGKRTPKASTTGTWELVGAAVGKRTPTGTATSAWTFVGVAVGDAPPNLGTATGTFNFAATASGHVTKQGAATGLFSYVGAAVGDAPANVGAASGAFAFSGVAAGLTTRSGVATGSWTYAGVATGRRTPKAISTGTFSYVGTASGQRITEAASTGEFTFAGTTSGKRSPLATAVGTFVYSGLATGEAPANEGFATGTLTFAGAATGHRAPQATSVGTFTYTGIASGDVPPNDGSATSTFAFAGEATGKRTPGATSTGAFTFTGSASGDVPPNEGLASGDISYTGSGTGKRVPKATSIGTFTFEGTASGDVPPNDGLATGTFTLTGLATGTRTPKATASGTFAYASSATGQAGPHLGTSSGTFTFEGTTSGERNPVSTAAGVWHFVGNAGGDVPANVGSASGTTTYAGSASGLTSHSGSATGGFVFTGVAATSSSRLGSATGTFTFEGTATGARSSLSSATGSFAFAGASQGERTPVASAAGAWHFVGSAGGDVPANEGDASGTTTYTTIAAGEREPKATATGTLAYAGTASGDVPANAGTTTGTFAFTGAADGERTPVSTASGMFTYTGTASGDALPNEGSTSGTFSFVGASDGQRTPLSTATGFLTWLGTASGDVLPNAGATTGTFTFAGTAAGRRQPLAISTGTFLFEGAATGKRTPQASATGTTAYAGTATGDVPPNGGSSSGAFAFTGSASGQRAPGATSTGSLAFMGAAAGVRVPLATATGVLSFSGSATGDVPPNAGATEGAFAFIGIATGRRLPKATSTGTFAFEGAVFRELYSRLVEDVLVAPIDWAYARVGVDHRIVARVTILSVSRPKMSEVLGYETCEVQFFFDLPVRAWSVRRDSSTHLDGEPVGFWSAFPPTQYGSLTISSSSLRRGANTLTVYGQSLEGVWSR